jgi:hypothetical protein
MAYRSAALINPLFVTAATFFTSRTKNPAMANQFGHGFITSIMLIAKHFALPPEKAWPGAGDHVEGLLLPEKFRGTEVEELTTLLRKKVVWHHPGTMDKEDARDVIFTLNRLVVAVDRELGIPDAEVGEFR